MQPRNNFQRVLAPQWDSSAFAELSSTILPVSNQHRYPPCEFVELLQRPPNLPQVYLQALLGLETLNMFWSVRNFQISSLGPQPTRIHKSENRQGALKLSQGAFSGVSLNHFEVAESAQVAFLAEQTTKPPRSAFSANQVKSSEEDNIFSVTHMATIFLVEQTAGQHRGYHL